MFVLMKKVSAIVSAVIWPWLVRNLCDEVKKKTGGAVFYEGFFELTNTEIRELFAERGMQMKMDQILKMEMAQRHQVQVDGM